MPKYSVGDIVVVRDVNESRVASLAANKQTVTKVGRTRVHVTTGWGREEQFMIEDGSTVNQNSPGRWIESVEEYETKQALKHLRTLLKALGVDIDTNRVGVAQAEKLLAIMSEA